MLKFNKKDNKNLECENNILNRNEVLANISNASGWGTIKDISNHSVIKENLQCLKKILGLSIFDNEYRNLERNNNNDNKLSGWLTNRQIHCMYLINHNVQEKNVQGAYHELYDFIESYNKLSDKPIDMVEKIIIRNSIIQIESILS